MNIRFLSIDIKGFRSIDRITANFDNQGIVIVKGINEYEDKATSNGSGKSSIFEALVYAIFEETSSGEKNIENRILNDGFFITLKFELDNVNYTIVRNGNSNKSNVCLYQEDKDISARTKTDTNKLILNLLNINKNIFLDSIFLSQTVSSNLASLSPTARKERLEILTSTDSVITNFKDKLKSKQNEYETKCVDAQLNKNKLEGNLQSIENQKNTINSKIKEIDEQIAKRDALGNLDTINNEIETYETNIKIFKSDLDAKEKEIESKDDEIEEYRKVEESDLIKKDKLNNDLNEARQEYNEINNSMVSKVEARKAIDCEITRLTNEILKIKNSEVCPTCGRKYENINESHIKETINNLNNDISLKHIELNDIAKEIDSIKDKLQLKEEEGKSIKLAIESQENIILKHKEVINEFSNSKKILLEDKQRIQNNIKLVEQDLEDFKIKKEQILSIEVGNKTEYENMLKDLDKQKLDIQNKLEEQLNVYNQNNDCIECIKHCLQLVTKDFRTYLLKNSIIYLNNILNNYSKELFSNEKDLIHITEDDTKLDILLGDATYESLSGGERTRVNIALLLAQKSLANTIGNMSCNLIILDEILGYCDSQAETNVIDLIMKELESLESIYMVSHKEIPIGYDNELIIVKDKNGLSHLKSY